MSSHPDINSVAHVRHEVGVGDATVALLLTMSAEPDVREVLRLRFLPGEGRWLYLFETPFASFPRFVVGASAWVDGVTSDVRVLSYCGEIRTALIAFEAAWVAAGEVQP